VIIVIFEVTRKIVICRQLLIIVKVVCIRIRQYIACKMSMEFLISKGIIYTNVSRLLSVQMYFILKPPRFVKIHGFLSTALIVMNVSGVYDSGISNTIYSIRNIQKQGFTLKFRKFSQIQKRMRNFIENMPH
jgi:hypothetical protein